MYSTLKKGRVVMKTTEANQERPDVVTKGWILWLWLAMLVICGTAFAVKILYY